MSVTIDKGWFEARMSARGLSMSEVARRMQLDKSALSRVLSGRRNLKAAEVVKIATILNVPQAEVLAHVAGGNALAATGGVKAGPAPEGNPTRAKISDHPGFGFMKGLIKIEEGFDITGPFSDEPWNEGYLGDDR